MPPPPSVETSFREIGFGWFVGDFAPDVDDVPVGVLPQIGGGTLAALGRRAGHSLEVAAYLRFAADTEPNGSPWYFSLPFANPRSDFPFVLPCLAYDYSANRWWTGVAWCGHISAYAEAQELVVVPFFGTNAQRISETVPFSWAANDRLIVGNALEAFGN